VDSRTDIVKFFRLHCQPRQVISKRLIKGVCSPSLEEIAGQLFHILILYLSLGIKDESRIVSVFQILSQDVYFSKICKGKVQIFSFPSVLCAIRQYIFLFSYYSGGFLYAINLKIGFGGIKYKAALN